MAKIALYTRNILEDGTFTVTGDPDNGFPESRLHDRAVSLFWKDTVTEAKNFLVDQSADAQAVDFLAVHRHNFSGINMQWQYSSDNFSADTNDAVTDWTQGDNKQIIKTFTPALTQDYWRVTLASMANPQAGEIFMSFGREFEATIDPAPSVKRVSNVRWNRSIGGLERSTKMGDARRARSYSLFLDATDLALFQAAMAEIDEYSLPFYIKDHDGNYYICRITDDIQEKYDHNAARTRISLNIIEEL